MGKSSGTIRKLLKRTRENGPRTIKRIIAHTKERGPKRIKQGLAWGVHLYTALGLVCAAGIAVCIHYQLYEWTFVLMFTATVIDATDGTLARAIKVKEVLPGFDGRRLDDLTDFLTYVFLPLFLIWHAEVLPKGQEAWLLAPLLASAYGFCQVSAKTDDGYFLGFPSYWNMAAFYFYVLQPPGWVAISLLVIFAVLTFVPSRYLYPTQRGWLNAVTNVLGIVWALLLVAILWRLVVAGRTDEWAQSLTILSAFFPAYYLLASWIISLRPWGRRLRLSGSNPLK
jgi:phosphatidylcholine synthase